MGIKSDQIGLENRERCEICRVWGRLWLVGHGTRTSRTLHPLGDIDSAGMCHESMHWGESRHGFVMRVTAVRKVYGRRQFLWQAGRSSCYGKGSPASRARTDGGEGLESLQGRWGFWRDVNMRLKMKRRTSAVPGFVCHLWGLRKGFGAHRSEVCGIAALQKQCLTSAALYPCQRNRRL